MRQKGGKEKGSGRVQKKGKGRKENQIIPQPEEPGPMTNLCNIKELESVLTLGGMMIDR